MGVTDDNSTQATITQSSATQTAHTHTVSNTIDLLAKADERYSVEIYCDVVFGTFAYREVATSPAPLITGIVLASDGKPAPDQMVTLNNNGRKFTTRSDGSGKYAFRAGTIKAGKSVLATKGFTKTFELLGAAAKVDLNP